MCIMCYHTCSYIIMYYYDVVNKCFHIGPIPSRMPDCTDTNAGSEHLTVYLELYWLASCHKIYT